MPIARPVHLPSLRPWHFKLTEMKPFLLSLGIFLAVTLEAGISTTTVAPKANSASKTTAKFSWGLDRIDQRSLPLDSRTVAPNMGFGVTVYVLDTGIDITHVGFNGNVRMAETSTKGDFINDEWGKFYGALDSHGHGTHNAGIVGGVDYGVAPGADIVALRVTDSRKHGDPNTAIRAVHWLNEHAVRPAVVLMSLNYGDVPDLREAVRHSVMNGLVYVAASGSMYTDACKTSPSGADGVITVSATTIEDKQTNMSNWGPCVDIWAPGKHIPSLGFNNQVVELSGTSMSAAFVAGVAALYLSDHPDASPDTVKYALLNNATANEIKLQPGTISRNTSNYFLYGGVELH